jgi:hypothetical protein
MVIDWKDFYEDSFKNGQKPDRIIMKIESAVGDCFGPKYREEVMKRLEELDFDDVSKKRGHSSAGSSATLAALRSCF